MIHRIRIMLGAFACVLAVASCTTTETRIPTYSYSATIWQALSADQMLLTIDGTTNQRGGHLGHYLGEPVSIGVSSIPDASVVIGSFSISSQTIKKSLPVRKWSKGGKTIYAICDPQASDQHAVVSIETDNKALTEPLLKELIERFVPDKSDAGDVK